MQIVLVVAALVSLLIEEYGTAIGLALLTLFNAWLGYHQEGKAEAAAASLGQMMKSMAKVRRDGEMAEIPAEQIVPGDIVVVDAGDRVPADGRVILAATLQIEEGALTGESVAVEKDTARHRPARRRHRGPREHGVHEHQRDPGPRRDPRDHHGHGLGGRPHRPHAVRAKGGEDPAHQAGGPAHHLHHHRGPLRVRRDRGDGPGPGRLLRGALRDRRGAGGRLHPGCAARRRHHDPVRGLGQHGQEERHHEGPARGRDAGLHVGHQLGQDRHPDPEPDDGAGDRDRAAPLHGQRRGLQLRRPGPADHRRRRTRPRLRDVPVRAVQRLRHPGRRGHRGPHGGGAVRARAEGRRGRHGSSAGTTRGWRPCPSTPTTSSWPPSTGCRAPTAGP